MLRVSGGTTGALHPVQIHQLWVPATQVSGVTPAPGNVAGQALGYPTPTAPHTQELCSEDWP